MASTTPSTAAVDSPMIASFRRIPEPSLMRASLPLRLCSQVQAAGQCFDFAWDKRTGDYEGRIRDRSLSSRASCPPESSRACRLRRDLARVFRRAIPCRTPIRDRRPCDARGRLGASGTRRRVLEHLKVAVGVTEGRNRTTADDLSDANMKGKEKNCTGSARGAPIYKG